MSETELNQIKKMWAKEVDDYLLKAASEDLNNYPEEVQRVIIEEAHKRGLVDSNDQSVEDNSVIEGGSSTSSDDVPVCPNCFKPCNPLDNYCPHCGSNEAINPLASYMPFVDLRFRAGMVGKLWRKAISSDTPKGYRFLYWIMLIIFLPIMPILFLIALPFIIFEKKASRNQQESPYVT